MTAGVGYLLLHVCITTLIRVQLRETIRHSSHVWRSLSSVEVGTLVLHWWFGGVVVGGRTCARDVASAFSSALPGNLVNSAFHPFGVGKSSAYFVQD